MHICVSFLLIGTLANFISILSYDVAPGSEITSCNKIDNSLVVYIKIYWKLYDVHNNIAYIMTIL